MKRHIFLVVALSGMMVGETVFAAAFSMKFVLYDTATGHAYTRSAVSSVARNLDAIKLAARGVVRDAWEILIAGLTAPGKVKEKEKQGNALRGFSRNFILIEEGNAPVQKFLAEGSNPKNPLVIKLTDEGRAYIAPYLEELGMSLTSPRLAAAAPAAPAGEGEPVLVNALFVRMDGKNYVVRIGDQEIVVEPGAVIYLK